jgi:glycosyltransferase involved in cell wall biosynthesis
MYGYLLSVLVPLFNEEEFIGILLQRVIDAPLPAGVEREVIVVNDCSRDNSAEAVKRFISAHPEYSIQLFEHRINQGKGAAIRTAIAHAKGDFTIIQDADLEYDPREYARLLGPLLSGKADAVFGSRFMVSGERRVLYFWHSLGNRLLTLACNIAADLNLTDMETCYKLVRTSLLQSIPIRSDRFGIEPELTIKLARRRARIYEMPISYHGRTYEEGKKIGLKDAFEAFWVILKFGLSNDLYVEAGPRILATFSEARRLNRWMADTIMPFIGQRVLEIGAGFGNLTRQLAPRRPYYAATDVDAEYLLSLSNTLKFSHLEVRECHVDNPEEMSHFQGTVDTIVCLNVLEHVADDGTSVRNMYNALEPGGRAIVLVPHDQKIYGRLDEALGHRCRYSREQLRQLLESAGFRVDRIIDFNRSARPGWVITGSLLKRSHINRVLLRSFDRWVGLWRKVDPWLPWAPMSIIGVGVKDAAIPK